MPDMNPLEKYLNEHLAGSSAAIRLLETLSHGNPSYQSACRTLKHGITRNRRTLEGLLDQAGFKRSLMMECAARLMSEIALLRFRMNGLNAGQLGLLEALEALELGVQGQLILWRGLRNRSGAVKEWEGTDFAALENSAAEQRATVEALRLEAVKAAFFRPLPSLE